MDRNPRYRYPTHYDKKSFDQVQEKKDWQLIVSHDGHNDSLIIHQDAFLSLRSLDAEQDTTYTFSNQKNGPYLMVIEGTINISDQTLGRRDAIGITETEKIVFTAKTKSRILLIEVPMATTAV